MKKMAFIAVFSMIFLSQSVFAEEVSDPSALTAKINQVLANQEKILAKLDFLADEINTVKVRSTR